MRILQVVPHYVPAYRFGGVLQAAHALSRALVELGHEVTVCTTRMADRHEDIPGSGDEGVDVDNVKVFYDSVVVSRYWGFSAAMARRLLTEVARAEVVFTHFHYQFASVIGGWASRLRRKPYVVFAHGSLNRHALVARHRLAKEWYLRLVEGGNLRRALFVAYQSSEEMEQSLTLGRGRVIPNGVDPGAFEAREAGGFRRRYPELKERLVYLFLGRLDVNKGLDVLLRAFADLLLRARDAHLVIAGSDERGYGRAVREMVRELDVGERVTLTGLLDTQAKLSALRDADVFVLPSRYEGLSMAMLEAMCAGLPVVITDRVGLWREVAAEGCGIVVPLDAALLGTALDQLGDPGRRKAMGDQGRRLVLERYTWPLVANRLLGEIRAAL